MAKDRRHRRISVGPLRPAAHKSKVEALESRQLLTASNALDEIDFGILSSESAHGFEPGYVVSQMPLLGTGTVGASSGLTYREATGSQVMIFTLAVDPNRQNYLTVRLWGNDIPTTNMDLLGEIEAASDDPTSIDAAGEAGGNVQFANRFEYNTVPIPITTTMGKGFVQLTLTFGGTSPTLDRPVYSAYSSTDPDFTPSSTDPQGTAPTLTGQKTLTTLTPAQAIGTTASPGILLTELQSIYGSGGYFNSLLARQAIVLSSTANSSGVYTWTPPTGAPQEVTGLDLFTNLTSWMAANPNATADQWRQQIGGTMAGPGYTAFPDELISALTETYVLPATTDANGNVVTGLSDYHDPALMARIVAAMDGSTYEQDSDGDLIQQGASAAANSAWTGLTSAARTTGTYTGSTSREPTVHGGGDLEGVDTYTLGWSIIQLLNDPVGASLFSTYLNGSYDANLNGGSMSRAAAYERMLFGMINYYAVGTGGAESQNTFQMLALYSSYVALEKLQALYPDSAYVVSSATYNAGNYLGSATPLQAAEMVMGLYPDTLRGVVNANPTNYGLTAKGFGEAGGALSTGFDGGGYGQIIPWLTPRIAQLASWDPTASPAVVAQFDAVANNTTNSFDQFLSPLDNATVNSSGVITANTYDFAEETYITYREPKDVNVDAQRFNFNDQFLSSDPIVGLDDPYALRSAYLDAIYGLSPSTADGAGNGGNSGSPATEGGSINYLKDLASYEATIKSLVNVDPATLTPLPGESGQPDFAFADVQAGAVAFMNNGERVYANLDWRNDGVTSDIARIHDTTATIDHDAEVIMPFNSATVQPDGNLTSSNLLGQKILRYGNYLFVLNNGSTAYTATLPPGSTAVEDLITKNMYLPGTSVSVPAGQAAIFWLAAGNTVAGLSSGTDIGSVGTAGTNSYTAGVYTVTGAGADVGASADAFHFVSNTVSGDTTVSAQILSQTTSNTLGQAGAMIRDGSAANAVFAAVLRTPAGGIRFYYRASTGSAAAWVAVPDPATVAWVKLARSGNNLSAYSSADGINWIQIGTTQSISLQTSAQVGLAVSSNSTSATATATFANVIVSPAVAPTVAAIATTSATNVSGSTANLSVLGADAAGESTLTYTWYAAGTAPDQVIFSTNGTNAAKSTTATFSAAGVYTLEVTLRDAAGASTTSGVTIIVLQTLTGLTLTPATVTLVNGQSQVFAATPTDQFGMPIKSASPVNWSIPSGIGTVDQSGLYIVPASGSGTTTVQATLGTLVASATVTIPAVPTPIIGIFSGNADIGIQSSSESSSYNGSGYTVAGTGDIGGTSDSLQFLYIPLTGDGTITTEVTSQTNTNQWAKAGVMFRDSLSANAMEVFAAITPGKGLTYQYRNSTGGSTNFTNTSAISYPYTYWVRLTRAGNVFSGFTSPDGVTWSQIGSQTIAMHTTAYVGLISAAEVSPAISTDTFTNVTLTSPNSTPHLFSNILPIGAPTLATYSDSTTANTASITDEGGDIWNAGDQFEFAYDVITGNATLITEVTSQTNTGVWAKAGIMVRDSTSPAAAFVDLLATPGHGVSLQYRSTDGQNLAPTTNYVNTSTTVIAPVWLALVRSGSTVTGYYDSTAPTAAPGVSGSGWTQVSSKSVTLGTSVDVGLAMTSNNTSSVGTANYSNISITGTANVSPAVATPAAATPGPVTGSTAALSVTGADSDGGASNLIYYWSPVGIPPGSVTFTANGTNTAKNTVATFAAAGTYLLEVIIQDSGGATAPLSFVSVTVNQTLTSVAISPATVTVGPISTQAFSAIALDQFGLPMVTQPTSFNWSVSNGSGSITSSGIYTAGNATGSATVKAATGAVSGTALIAVNNQSPIIASSIGATATTGTTTAILSDPVVDDGGAANLVYTWALSSGPAGVGFTANSNNSAGTTTAAFTQAGTYVFNVTAVDSGGLSISSTVTAVVVPTVYTGSSLPDNYYIRLATDGSTEQIWVGSTTGTGTPTYSVAESLVPSLTFNTAGGGDSVTIDFTNGNPVPTGGVNFNGGSAGSLIIDGGASANAATVNASSIIFDGSAPITFTNTQTITLNGSAGNDVITQTAQPSAAIFFNGGVGNDTLNINGGTYAFITDASLTTSNLTVNVNNSGSLATFNATQHLAALNLAAGGKATVAATGGSSPLSVLVTGSVSITNGVLDLTNNDMIVHNGSRGTLSALLASGLNAGRGYWNGQGIISSKAASNSTLLTTLGILLNDSGGGHAIYSSATQNGFDGQNTTATDVLIKYTFYGDANLDGQVDGSDYSRIDSGFLSGATLWQDGDFNGDGVVNGSDYTLIDNAFNAQSAAMTAEIANAPPVASARSAVSSMPISSSLSGVDDLRKKRRYIRRFLLEAPDL